MAIINHYIRESGGDFSNKINAEHQTAAEYCINEIQSGVPFRVYRGDAEITNYVDAMCSDGEFKVIEGSGGKVGKILTALFIPFGFLVLLKPKTPGSFDVGNQQAESPNNSLTDRSNKPRPFARAYDICGTVQTICSDLMNTYRTFDSAGREYEYGYYYLGRDYLDTPADQITDGDSLLSDITGSSVNIYDPFKSPNNSEPRQIVGQKINEKLYITVRSNEVDGIELKAPNEISQSILPATVTQTFDTQEQVEVATITTTFGETIFSDNFAPGDVATITDLFFSYLVDTTINYKSLSGDYTVLSVTDKTITLELTDVGNWAGLNNQALNGGEYNLQPKILLKGSEYTNWFSIKKIAMNRALINLVTPNGLYKDSGNGKISTEVVTEISYQYLDDQGNTTGAIIIVPTTSTTMTGKTSDEIGLTVEIPFATASRARFRARRLTLKDYTFQGSVVDEIKFRDLYGQTIDLTPDYGNLTTAHTSRRKTARATAVKEPQLKMVVTEMINKYLGNGVFESTRTPNTKAVQSLIRLMRDPIVGGLSMSNASMDKLLTVQNEIESYFGTPEAGQFCYTFDEANQTAQDIATTIADAVFCSIGREGNDIVMSMEKPQQFPAMLFTHRSKIGEEKWDRSFDTRESYDSVEYSYTDPKTNIKEVIRIPETGGVKPHKVEGVGVRNYKQAFWAANRLRQKDKFRRITVEFNATQEGIYAKRGVAISVVKGSRVSTFDGYIVAQNGLQLTLSQEVEFTPNDTHTIQLKRRDGTVESVEVVSTTINKRTVNMLSMPSEPIYTGNSATKTEFSFGNEARHLAQMIIPGEVDPGDGQEVKISGYNYDSRYYLFDTANPLA